tara:strand:- start:533 stop:694 length:162 start_codon:yes stop_codon:yes gene_type:complete
LHLEIDGDIKILDAHAIADEVGLALMEAYLGTEVIIHQKPGDLVITPTLTSAS